MKRNIGSKPALFLLFAAVWLLAAMGGIGAAEEAKIIPDQIFFNGKIVTLDEAGTIVPALAVKDGKIIALGSDEEIKKLAGPFTEPVNLNGKTAVPGLIDAHCHPMETIMMKEGWVDARYPGCPTVKQALINLAKWAKKTPRGQWIFVACVSASENKFAEKRLPTKAELDNAAPHNPVALADGTHLAVVNSLALKKLGITKGMTALKGGGRVILDKNGMPNGTLTDAMGAIPTTPTLKDLERYYAGGIQKFWNRFGFTSLLAITPAPALPVLQGVSAKMKPTLRYTVSVWTEPDGSKMPEQLDKFRFPKAADPAFYTFGGIKAWIDGENDCRTGYMYEKYQGHFDTDPPGNQGTLVTDPKKAEKFAQIANRNRAICMFHCSGDRATDIGLSAYEKAVKAGEPYSIRRIEHFGMFQLTDKQLERAKALEKDGFKISVQPTWLLELVKADYENMGKKLTETGFRFRSMIDAGLEPAAGTDMTGIYLANINPLTAIYAMVTRESDRGTFEPKEAVSVEEAFKMWTIWAAKSMGEEKLKGSLEKGKFADLTVLSQDPFTIPKERLKMVRVLKTVVGGETVYQVR